MLPPQFPPPVPTERPFYDRDSVGIGVLLAFAIPILIAIACGLLAGAFSRVTMVSAVPAIVVGAVALAPGLVQLAWIIPLTIRARRLWLLQLRKGLIIGASIVFLLNSACWGMLFAIAADIHIGK